MISDKLLINLKILSKIQKNGKITRSYDGIISLDSESFYQPVRRFLASDSRKQAVFEINSIVTESLEAFQHILNSKYLNKHYYATEEFHKHVDNLELLLNEFEQCKVGVENLKFTYQNDQNIVSQLDIILLKMNTTIKDIHYKLGNFKCYISNEIHNNGIDHDVGPITVEPAYHDVDVEADISMNQINS